MLVQLISVREADLYDGVGLRCSGVRKYSIHRPSSLLKVTMGDSVLALFGSFVSCPIT